MANKTIGSIKRPGSYQRTKVISGVVGSGGGLFQTDPLGQPVSVSYGKSYEPTSQPVPKTSPQPIQETNKLQQLNQAKENKILQDIKAKQDSRKQSVDTNLLMRNAIQRGSVQCYSGSPNLSPQQRAKKELLEKGKFIEKEPQGEYFQPRNIEGRKALQQYSETQPKKTIEQSTPKPYEQVTVKKYEGKSPLDVISVLLDQESLVGVGYYDPIKRKQEIVLTAKQIIDYEKYATRNLPVGVKLLTGLTFLEEFTPTTPKEILIDEALLGLGAFAGTVIIGLDLGIKASTGLGKFALKTGKLSGELIIGGVFASEFASEIAKEPTQENIIKTTSRVTKEILLLRLGYKFAKGSKLIEELSSKTSKGINLIKEKIPIESAQLRPGEVIRFDKPSGSKFSFIIERESILDIKGEMVKFEPTNKELYNSLKDINKILNKPTDVGGFGGIPKKPVKPRLLGYEEPTITKQFKLLEGTIKEPYKSLYAEPLPKEASIEALFEGTQRGILQKKITELEFETRLIESIKKYGPPIETMTRPSNKKLNIKNLLENNQRVFEQESKILSERQLELRARGLTSDFLLSQGKSPQGISRLNLDVIKNRIKTNLKPEQILKKEPLTFEPDLDFFAKETQAQRLRLKKGLDVLEYKDGKFSIVESSKKVTKQDPLTFEIINIPKSISPVEETITLYHATKISNLPSISEKGLVPGKSLGKKGVAGTGGKVYTAISEKTAIDYKTMMGEDSVVLRIDMPKTKFFEAVKKEGVGTIGQVQFGKIPKEYIRNPLKDYKLEYNPKKEFFDFKPYKSNKDLALDIRKAVERVDEVPKTKQQLILEKPIQKLKEPEQVFRILSKADYELIKIESLKTQEIPPSYIEGGLIGKQKPSIYEFDSWNVPRGKKVITEFETLTKTRSKFGESDLFNDPLLKDLAVFKYKSFSTTIKTDSTFLKESNFNLFPLINVSDTKEIEVVKGDTFIREDIRVFEDTAQLDLVSEAVSDKTSLKFDTDSAYALKFAQPQKVSQSEAQKYKPKLKQELQELKRPEEEKLFPFLYSKTNLFRKESDMNKGYVVYVKEPKQKKFSQLNSQAIKKQDAENLLAWDLDNSTARSGYIKPVNQKPKDLGLNIPSTYFHGVQDKLRPYKIKMGKKIAINGVIEKSSYLIDTVGEKKELSAFKAYSKIKKNPNKLKSMVMKL